MTPAERVAALAPLVGIMARERTKDSPDRYDEARQEGLIHAWQAAEARPDAPTAYLTAAARNGVLGTLRGRKPFGAEGRRGWRDAYNTAGPLTTRDADGDEATLDVVDPDSELPFFRVESADARAIVRAAVAVLPEADRLLVWRRFGEHLTWAEIAALQGVKSASTPQDRFSDYIVPALRTALTAP